MASSPDPLDSAIPVGSGPGNTVPPNTPPPVPPTPPPAATEPARGKPSGNDKIWAILSHVSLCFGIGYIVLPVVVYLAMKSESEFASENAREALNFHISLLIYSLCLTPLIALVVGLPLLAIMWVAAVVLSVVAAIKASDNGCYRYPLTIRLVK